MSNIIIVGYPQTEAEELRRKIDTIVAVHGWEADSATVILDVQTKWCGKETPAPYLVVRHSDPTKLTLIASTLNVGLNIDTEAELIHKYYPSDQQLPDIKTFENIDSAWSHDGEYSVTLMLTADWVNVLPPGASIKDDIVRVSDGRIEQAPGGIQFYAEGKPFTWAYRHIRSIRDKDNNLLWVNYHYR